jgi:hypothetical protein
MAIFKAQGVLSARFSSELRKGFCEQCGTKTVKEFYMDGSRKRVRMICPKCGGQGKLIVREVAIDPPAISCLKFHCLVRFARSVLFSYLLNRYHEKRGEYAQAHRDDEIPEYYRTGRPMPSSIPQCIKEIIKLELRR